MFRSPPPPEENLPRPAAGDSALANANNGKSKDPIIKWFMGFLALASSTGFFAATPLVESTVATAGLMTGGVGCAALGLACCIWGCSEGCSHCPQAQRVQPVVAPQANEMALVGVVPGPPQLRHAHGRLFAEPRDPNAVSSFHSSSDLSLDELPDEPHNNGASPPARRS